MTEIAMETLLGPKSSGINVTPTASSAPDTEPIKMREMSKTSKLGAISDNRLPRQKTTQYAMSKWNRLKRPVVRANVGVTNAYVTAKTLMSMPT